MNIPSTYENVVAIVERSGGNESVGNMWLDTKIFSKETPISKIIAWADTSNSSSGKLIITIAE